jgi:hypothetical protein
MKIYTYYQQIKHHGLQEELIDLWKISWSRQGYEPIVLNLEDAKKHPYFETLESEMPIIFNKITGKNIKQYGMSCWLRWLAYATQKDEKFYVSDYDAINVNFPITESDNKLHLMDNGCPFLASGTPKQFENLCKAFVEVSNQRIDILKQQADHYHDQEFFHYNFMPRQNNHAHELRDKYNISLTRTRPKIGSLYNPNTDLDRDEVQVVHLAHRNIFSIKNNNPIYKDIDIDQLRIDMVKKILFIK